MVMWILLGITVLIAIFVFASTLGDGYYGRDWGGAFGFGFVTLILGSLATTLVCAILSAAPFDYPQDEARTTSQELRALTTSSELHGQTYLLGGYIDEDPVFRYIRAEGDGMVLRSVSADDSIVYEGDYEPRIDTITTTWGNPWLYPFTFENDTYEFYVPEGSVSGDISVTP